MLTREFLTLVLIAGVIATPVTYHASSAWLEGFAYRIQPDAAPFVAGVMTGLIVAVLAIGWQAVHAARQDPVTALRYE